MRFWTEGAATATTETTDSKNGEIDAGLPGCRGLVALDRPFDRCGACRSIGARTRFRAMVSRFKPTIEGIGMRIVLSVFLVMALATLGGCSFSDSSKSISDSISSPSKSSSDSSSGDDDKPDEPVDMSRYQSDISQLAVTYAKTGGDIGAFRTSVSKIAQEYGVTNWEADEMTNQAIGRGAGTAYMQEEAFTSFSKNLYGDDLGKQNELRTGYQETAQPE